MAFIALFTILMTLPIVLGTAAITRKCKECTESKAQDRFEGVEHLACRACNSKKRRAAQALSTAEHTEPQQKRLKQATLWHVWSGAPTEQRQASAGHNGPTQPLHSSQVTSHCCLQARLRLCPDSKRAYAPVSVTVLRTLLLPLRTGLISAGLASCQQGRQRERGT